MADRQSVYRRSILVLDRSFQVKYALALAALGGAVTGGCGGLIIWLTRATRSELTLTPDLVRELSARDELLVTATVGVAVFSAVVFGALGLLWTHRVAGPVYAMTRYLTELAQDGHYPTARPLREQDEMRDFHDLFHKVFEAMRAREVEEALVIRELLTQITPLATTPDAQQQLERLKSLHERKRQVAERIHPTAKA